MKKSKICIITPRSINDSPCLEKYKEIIKDPFDIIFWSKGENNVKFEAANSYKYTGIVPVEGGKLSKIKHYYLFTRFAKRIVERNKYDKLIIFPTHMAWLLQRLLGRKYKGKYILDIRDYAGENNILIRRMTAKAVNNSGLCVITSPSYTRFLPKNASYTISHNIQTIDEKLVERYRAKKRDPSKPIVMSFIGTVRFLEQQKKLISTFGNDHRFVIKYIGRGSEALKSYCMNGKYANVELVGQFDKASLGKYYYDTDMAINVYGNNDPALVYALSNKLYSVAQMGMPILCSPKTYMESISSKFGFGISVDLNNPNCCDYVYNSFYSLGSSKLYSNCDSFINKVQLDEVKFNKKVKRFLNQ